MPPDLLTRSNRSDESGAALAELAVVVPIMLVMLLVVFDLGRGFLEFVSVSNGARDGARVGATLTSDGTQTLCQANPSIVRDAAKAGGEPLGLKNGDVSVSYDSVSKRCSVTVNHTYDMVLPFVDGSFSLPLVGTVGPLWDGTMSETMVSA